VKVYRALTVAGSDSAGCAGIQADLRTFAALGVHGLCAVTAVTAQDSRRLTRADEVPLENIERQIDAVIQDIGVDAAKTGMLSSAPVVELVARKMLQHRIVNLVVDPVIVSTGGDRLLTEEGLAAVKTKLLPAAMLVTPNLREAEALTGRPVLDLREAARELHALGARAVLIKGGHADDPARATDLLFDGREFTEFSAPRIPTPNTRGSGCVLSAALAAHLARGSSLREAVGRAKEYVTEAIRRSYPIGHGCGPLGNPMSHQS
jgi:hydroxymethylpyrimidine/phosphomethylpyrimidine kinase